MATIQTLLSLAVCLFAGLMMTRALKRLHLPDVTAYLIAGVCIGTYCIGRFVIGGFSFGFNNEIAPVGNFTIISDIALGFIAFDIGNEFRLKDLKHTGKKATVIGIVQAVVATLVVDAALIGVHFLLIAVTGTDYLPLPACIILGAIASATAPAATLMVVRQYKAKGPTTSLLLPVVALDDAVGLIVFAISFGVARTFVSGTTDLVSIIVAPLVEIVASLVLGAIMGWLLTKLETLFHSNTNRLNMTIAFVFLTAALSMVEFSIGPVHVGFSSLLVCMMLGTVFCNLCPLSNDLMEKTDRWTAPLFALFFVISGAELELNVFADVAIVGIGVVYILFRCAGKYIGSYISTKATHCSPEVCKYLGITLFPQAGVALGMCITARQLGEQGDLIRNIILFSVLIYELFGPMLTRMALTRAGDIKPMSDEVKNRRQRKLEESLRQKNSR